MNYVELDRQRRALAEMSEAFQFDLMKPRDLAQFANDCNVKIFSADTIIGLWQAGLLRADVIVAKRKIETPYLPLASAEDGVEIYSDERPVPHIKNGYGGVFLNKTPTLIDFELYFHPFRLYVLYHVDRVFSSMISSTQYLLNPDGMISLSRQEKEMFDRWTSGEECAERFEHWNRIAEIAIILEPSAYRIIFDSIKWRFPHNKEILQEKLNDRRKQTKIFLSTISQQEINDIRQDLCRDAEIVDSNKIVHVLLRLMAGHERLKLRSSLGACMLFITMAEIIRRAAEDAKGEQLPEEDEIGFGQWMEGARKSIYGSERILDAPPEVRRDFLTSMGLDYGVKVRCYVEGETELGAMVSAVGDGAGTEFINLKGQVIERKGKGLAFLASLKNDLKSHVFSVVLLDGDSADNVRTLKKAAGEGEFFGRFFVASPDFEFGNFTTDELVDVLLTLAAYDHKELPLRNDLLSQVAAAKSAKAFFRALQGSQLQEIAKSKGWGIALMSHALRHPELPMNHDRAGCTRPVIIAARLILIARGAGYVRSLDRYTVDPETGELREK